MKEPTIGELFECTKLAGLKVEVEADKAYCRDYWIRGRIRVCLFDADGKPLEADIANRKFFYSTLPTHKMHFPRPR